MLRRWLTGGLTVLRPLCYYSNAAGNQLVASVHKKQERLDVQSHFDWDDEMRVIRETECRSPLEADPDLRDVAPFLQPTYNLASLVNRSPMLQKMVELGVELHHWDRIKGAADQVLKKDFEVDVQPVIRFLVDIGVHPDSLGGFFTRNPFLLTVSLDDLHTRHNYLESKKFSKEAISRICTRNPFWLQFSTARIDARLAFFKDLFDLSASELRQLSAKEPRLITSKLDRVKDMNFGFKEEMGFLVPQIKSLLLSKPKLWISDRKMLVDRFDYIHNTMGMDHSVMVTFPAVLTCRQFRLKQRHEFLRSLGRHQYDPKQENYVSPLDVIRGSDSHFASCVARSTIDQFNDFCKTQ